MADGKWIRDLDPDMTVAAAARRVLDARFRVIRDVMPLAVRESERDPEHVHQLRVGTRRAGAALRIFASAVPDKVYRKSRKFLRGARRAAGSARDWDVFLIELQERREASAPKEEAGLDYLLGYGAGQRAAAQEELTRVGEHHLERLRGRTEGLLEAIRDPEDAPGQTLQGLGRNLLTDLARELDWAASGDLEDYEHLHQVRILGKQLRYALEVFIDCFGPGLRETVYPAVEEMQEMLGRANDSHVAGRRLGALRDRLRQMGSATWKRYQPALEGLLRFHQRRLPRERNRFVRWWKHWPEGPGHVLQELLADQKPPQGQTA